MPPKQAVSREMVIEAALEVVRDKGQSALSARSIARVLSCSTQPIYSCFGRMKDLEDAVIRAAQEHMVDTYLTGGRYAEQPFFSMGIGYIQMARKEPNLFDMLHQPGHAEIIHSGDLYPASRERLVDSMATDAVISHLDRETLSGLLSHMWIYTHGLAMLARNNPKLTRAQIEAKLEDMGRTLIESKLKEKKDGFQ